MKLSELILAIGDDKVQLQNLDNCADTLDWSAKKGTKITFGTEIALTPDGTEKMGLVVWLDRSAVKAALEEYKGAQR
jgi:hypothetical protein